MYNRRLFELIILGSWLLIAILVTIDYSIKTSESIKLPQNFSLTLHPNNEIEIKKISVLSGNSFDIVLKDKDHSRIIVCFPFIAVKSAKDKVIDVLAEASTPRVILIEQKKDGKWEADIRFFLKEKETSLIEWLKEKELVKE